MGKKDLAGEIEDFETYQEHTSEIYQSRYLLRMQDEYHQHALIHSDYIVKLIVIAQHLHKQGYWGQIIQMVPGPKVMLVYPLNGASVQINEYKKTWQKRSPSYHPSPRY